MQQATHIATILGTVVAATALVVGVVQFTETQKLTRKNLELQAETLQQDRETKAIELFLKFNEQQVDLAPRAPPKKSEAAFWRANAMLATTEAVFRLTKGDSGWDETVAWMLQVQRPFLESTEFNCKTFANDFVTRMKAAAKNFKCMQ